MSKFKHPLAQNDEHWEGYTVFTLKFNGVPVKFVALVDAKHVLEKSCTPGESNKQSALFKIGKFEFFQSSIEKENYYIMHESGEGGDFPKLEVSAAIEKYYTENF